MAKIKEFIIKHESRIILIAGFILVAVISFEAGVIKSREYKENPVIVENVASSHSFSNNDDNNAPEAQKTAQESQNSAESINTPAQSCGFVGSKNSNKYHLPGCRWAKNIKPENRVCFSSEDEAKSKGYLADKNCIK